MTRFTYRDCKAYYRGLWDSMQIRAGREDDLKRLVKTMLSHKAAYEAVEKKTSVPWQVVGIIHCRESAFNFKTHLHNGDPLSKRTRHVPSGRPVNGTPPFTWEESAIDALRYDKLDLVGEWPVERICFELEKYNGSGYFKRNLPSPYLRSFTNHHVKGKFVQDSVFDPDAVDDQAGGMALYLTLTQGGHVTL